MKISKLLKFLLGLSGWMQMGVVEGEASGGSTDPLDAFSAADAFSSLLGGDAPNENETPEDESDEAAAERLAKLELSGKTEDAPKDGASDTPPGADDVTIEVDGKMVTLTKEQIAENHKNGLRQADYTRKTMDAAEARKTAEAETTKARQERDVYAQKLNNFAITTHAALQELGAELTAELAQTDPQEYLIKKHIFDARQAQFAQAQQELGKIEQQQKQEQSDAHQAFLQAQHQMILEKVPEWSDPAKMKAGFDVLEPFLVERGFKPEDGRTVLDARVMLLAKDAMEYRNLMERAKKAVGKVATLPVKAERPGTPQVSKPDGRTAAMQRLGKSGSIKDAADAFSQFL